MSDIDPTLLPPEEWQTGYDNEQHKIMTEHGILDFFENIGHEVAEVFRDFEKYEALSPEAKAIRDILQAQIHENLVRIVDETRTNHAIVETVDASLAPVILRNRETERRGLMIQNFSVGTLFVSYKSPPTDTTHDITVQIAAGGYWEMPRPIFTGMIYGFWSAAGSPGCSVTELLRQDLS